MKKCAKGIQIFINNLYSKNGNMLIDKKLLLFGGKGGVGKTCCAAAASIYAASKGKKVLILSTDPAHSLSDCFEKQVGSKATKIKDNLDALELDAQELIKGYKKKYGGFIKQIADEGTFFSKEDIQEFFDLSLPGMDELIALIKVIDILEEDKYDLLILDTAPTGHTIRLLEMPELMTAYVKVLAEMRQKHRVVVSMMTGRYAKDEADKFLEKMYEDVKRIKAVLKDSAKTSFIPITIPEAMSVYETEKLVDVLRKHSIPFDTILINNVITDDCDFCKARKQEQEKHVKELRKRYNKVIEIPLFPNEVKGKSLEALSKILFGKKYELPKPRAEKLELPSKLDVLKIKPSLRLLLFGGKGGVGKTSCASAVALHESKEKKVLIFSTDPAHSLSDCLDIKVGDKVTKINDSLDALEIDSYALLNGLKLKYKKEVKEFFRSVFKPTTTATIDAPYDRRVMEDLFDLMPPGVDEIMALKTMTDLMKSKQYDLYILDTAPTGHTIRLLEMPQMAEEWVNALLSILEKYPIPFEIGDTLKDMLETIKEVRRVLANPQETNFIVVTNPDAMSLLETQDLVDSLKRLKVPAEYLVINKIIPKNDCGFCSAKRAEQISYIRKFQELKLKTVGVELFDKEVKGESLNKLSAALFK